MFVEDIEIEIGKYQYGFRKGRTTTLRGIPHAGKESE